MNVKQGSKTMASSSNPPCAACKFLRRKCQAECVFAPYFPPDQPQKFVNVHRIFGASNVSKLLNELHPHQREDAVNSLAYEAEMRLRDPVNGCVGIISLLHQQLRQLQMDLQTAKFELSKIQSLGITTGYGHAVGAVTTAVAVNTSHGVNGGGHGNRCYNYNQLHQHHYHQCVPQQLGRNFDAGNNCEANVLAMNIASFGQLSQLQQPSAAAVAARDDHTRRFDIT
ncbi:LOB domain-containing protein 6, partial [Mucuna pruriens]